MQKMKCSLSNAYTQRQWPAARPGWMARGSHSFTCHPHVYPRMEWAILHSFRKHSPDGVPRARWRTTESAYYSIYRPRKDERLSWPSWLTYGGRFTHISGHTSSIGQAWDMESSPVKDRRSTTVQRSQVGLKVNGTVCTRVCVCVQDRKSERGWISGS